MSKKKPEQSVHVRIDFPIQKRKVVLQSAIDTVQLLKRYDRIKEIREEKVKEMAKFRTALRGVHRLVRMVKLQELPLDSDDLKQVKTVAGRKVFSPVRKPRVVKSVKGKKEKKPKLSSIDKQLQALQNKLDKL